MGIKLSKRYNNLKIGDKININGKRYTVKETLKHKVPHEDAGDIIRYEFGNGYVLEYESDWNFFKCITKKEFLGVTTTRSKKIDIKSIELI